MRTWPLMLLLLLPLNGCWTQNSAPYQSTEQGGKHVPHHYDMNPDDTFSHVMRVAHNTEDWQTLAEHRYGAGWLATFHVPTSLFTGHEEVRLQIQPTSEGHSMVSMWSRTRERSQDLGSNSMRIINFFRELDKTMPIAQNPGVPVDYFLPQGEEGATNEDPTAPDSLRQAPIIPLDTALGASQNPQTL